MSNHSYDTCTKMIEFLVSKVKQKDKNVKLKALLIIKVSTESYIFR